MLVLAWWPDTTNQKTKEKKPNCHASRGEGEGERGEKAHSFGRQSDGGRTDGQGVWTASAGPCTGLRCHSPADATHTPPQDQGGFRIKQTEETLWVKIDIYSGGKVDHTTPPHAKLVTILPPTHRSWPSGPAGARTRNRTPGTPSTAPTPPACSTPARRRRAEKCTRRGSGVQGRQGVMCQT